MADNLGILQLIGGLKRLFLLPCSKYGIATTDLKKEAVNLKKSKDSIWEDLEEKGGMDK